jgi:condensin-2 complex subunit H2
MTSAGSACVYSKKVEYLYQLVYETLDMLASKK